MTEPRRKRISPASAIGYGVALGAARTYPNAFIATVATDPTLVSGPNALAHQLTGERTELVASTYMSVVADHEEIRFFRGSRKPRQVAAFASSVIERVELGSAQAGARVIPTLDLVCRAGAAQGRISMHLIRFGRIVPRFVRDDSLEDAVRRFSAAAGSAGGHRLIREN
jgi:hypothetical protein